MDIKPELIIPREEVGQESEESDPGMDSDWEGEAEVDDVVLRFQAVRERLRSQVDPARRG